MNTISKYLQRLYGKTVASFQPDVFTVWAIHTAEVGICAVYHSADWSTLHTTVAIACVAVLARALST